MDELGIRLTAAFVTGLLGSGHCFGMCGGIVGALALGSGGPAATPRRGLGRLLAHNAGRIFTYTAFGAIAGGVAGVALSGAGDWLPLATRGSRLFAAACFAGLALYLLGLPGPLAPVERLGARLFRTVQPLLRHLRPGGSLAATAAAGVVWGFLPCGLVYSTLLVALTSGTAVVGALSMLAFGLGTLPALLAAGLVSRGASRLARGTWPRRAAATAYFVAALWLVRAAIAPLPAQGSAPACHPAAVAGPAETAGAATISATAPPAGS